RQTLRVLLPPFFASELFIPRLTSFCAAHPQIDIQIDTRDPRPSSHPPTADVSILLADSEPQGLRSSRLFTVSLTAACSKEHVPSVARLGGEVFKHLALSVHKARPFALTSWAADGCLQTPEPKNGSELGRCCAAVRRAES